MIDELILEKKVMTNQIKDQDIINCIKDCVVENQFWINPKEISERLNISINDVQYAIQKSKDIVVNASGQLTTRALYKTQTPFLSKLLNTIKNKIN